MNFYYYLCTSFGHSALNCMCTKLHLNLKFHSGPSASFVCEVSGFAVFLSVPSQKYRTVRSEIFSHKTLC